jgi:hypothetical protein
MKFSLINIVESSGPLISGSWLQNHVGTLASAIEAARATEAANSNKIEVAVVAELSSTTPALFYWRDLTHLSVASVNK